MTGALQPAPLAVDAPPVAASAGGRAPTTPTERAIQVVLALLREHLAMDVVFVRHFSEGLRRFRLVEAQGHGPAAALAMGQPAQGIAAGVLLEVPVVLPDGRCHGMLCAFCAETETAAVDRRRRLLQHGAKLAARLLDNEQVLRELHRQSVSH